MTIETLSDQHGNKLSKFNREICSWLPRDLPEFSLRWTHEDRNQRRSGKKFRSDEKQSKKEEKNFVAETREKFYRKLPLDEDKWPTEIHFKRECTTKRRYSGERDSSWIKVFTFFVNYFPCFFSFVRGFIQFAMSLILSSDELVERHKFIGVREFISIDSGMKIQQWRMAKKGLSIHSDLRLQIVWIAVSFFSFFQRK